MSPALRLAINSLAGRRKRTILLALAVALSTALVAAVACGMGSINAAMVMTVESTLGRADLRVKDVAGERLDPALIELLASQPEVELLTSRTKGSLAVRQTTGGERLTIPTTAIDPAREYTVISPQFSEGRGIRTDAEIVLNGDSARNLSARIGDRLRIERPGPPLELEVVGISKNGAGDVLERFEATVSLRAMEVATLTKGRITELAIVLREGVDPDKTATRLQGLAPRSVLVQTTALVTAGVDQVMQARTIAFAALSVFASLIGGFIVMAGLTTGLLERQRELAIMRCIGADRGVLARAQLLIGAVIGSFGAVVGVPLGIGLAWLITLRYPDKLPAGLALPPFDLARAGIVAIGSGLLGAAWPAIAAARTTPHSAMTRRGVKPRPRAVIIAAALGLACIACQFLIAHVPENESFVIWGHITAGAPLMILGYILLSAAVFIIVASVGAPLLERLFLLPRGLLRQSAVATPFRNGATAAALMVGMAMMTGIWTMGSAFLRDGLGAIKFPDAFVHDWNGLDESDITKLNELDFVREACALTYYKIDNKVFGIENFQQPPTNFIAFEPGPFFRMTELTWVAGDERYAQRRLDEGGAVLVAKEFLIARRGYKIGDIFTVTHLDERFNFEIVGAVSSPGLDLVGYGFDIGKEYASVALGTVFGTRADLKRVFGSEAVHLIQMQYSRPIPPREAGDKVRAALEKPGVLIGDGREIKDGIMSIGAASLKIGSVIAVAAMIIGCLSVGNIVLAGIDTRRFEFGVLRAVGAGRWVLGRLIIAEVLLIGVTACILGTLLGLQDTLAALRIQKMLAGIELRFVPAWGAIAAGWAILLTLTVLVTLPLALRLVSVRVRELLAATRG